jgi:hypothetical protein
MKIILMILALFAALANPVSATPFPVDDASIVAYVQLSSVNLPDIADTYYDVRDLNERYILGTIAIPNGNRDYYINTYVDVDGWVVAYVPKDTPMAQMIQWSGKPYVDPPLFPTNLNNAIEAVCIATGIDYSTIEAEIKYYDFEHPDATDFTVIMDGTGTQDTGKFSLLIPDGITLYDISASVGYADCAYVVDNYRWDGKSLMEGCHGYDWSEYFNVPNYLWAKEKTHWITTHNRIYPANSATILVYSTPPPLP